MPWQISDVASRAHLPAGRGGCEYLLTSATAGCWNGGECAGEVPHGLPSGCGVPSALVGRARFEFAVRAVHLLVAQGLRLPTVLAGRMTRRQTRH